MSKAEWDPGNAGAGGLFGPPPAAGPAGSLKIVTTKMRPGYVTRNGVPVGELVPLRARQFVAADAAVTAFTGAPPIDAERFRADIDAVLDHDPSPRG